MIEKLEDRYKKALQASKEVHKGGKHYGECSVMDMITRDKELIKARNKFIHALGVQRFKELGYEM